MTRVAYTFKLRGQLLATLKKLAQVDNRALNNYVETVLEKHIQKLGYDHEDPHEVSIPRNDD